MYSTHRPTLCAGGIDREERDMLNLQTLNSYDETLAKLKGFAVLLSSNEVRDSMRHDTATGLEYILADIIDGFEAAKSALNRK